MKKSVCNMMIDVLSLVIFTAMISTGLLLKFILPPGSGRIAMVLASQGRGHQSVDLFMGLARHDWGEIHFYISLAFLVFLIMHLILHWDWIICMLWGTTGKPQSKARRYMIVGIIVFIVLTLSFPWIGQMLGQKKIVTRAELQNKINSF